ncbi:DegT/DnrJ/EryC1/StrS family aminotransferase [Candidatus Pelagibacter ubique]|nr:DegT/DnrJ/EryC1/StrS family aminotransferase [Candidatus Pelagibacter ubique]
MLKIPRGSINHKISDEVKNLFKSIFYNLNSQKIVERFEQKFAFYNERKFCCAFPFARTAFYYSIKSLNIPSGSEIIMSPITIKPILDVILELNLKPVFCDLDSDTLCYDEVQLEKKINHNTKLIVITYLFGMVPNLEIYSEFKKNGKFIIEDFSQCLNGKFKNKYIGTFGDISIYSSSSIKTLDTYGGGLAIMDKESYYLPLKANQKKLLDPSRIFLIKKIVTNLVRNILTNRFIFSFLTYYIIFFLNLISQNTKMLGDRSISPIKSLPKSWFQKYTSVQAEIGIAKLDQVREEDKKRIDIAEKIKNLLSSNEINFPNGNNFGSNVYWQLLFYTNHPLKIRNYLYKKGIDTTSTSLEKICSLKEYGYEHTLPGVEKIYNQSLFFPCFSKMNKKQKQKVFKVIKEL